MIAYFDRWAARLGWVHMGVSAIARTMVLRLVNGRGLKTEDVDLDGGSCNLQNCSVCIYPDSMDLGGVCKIRILIRMSVALTQRLCPS